VAITEEQDTIAGSSADTLVVDAFAGTGKTTTLVEYAKRRPRERMLYVAFNRSIKEEATTKFPSNVQCVTTHGLAFPTFGRKYKSKLGNPKAYHLSNALGLDIESAGQVLETITRFHTSTESEIDIVHALAAAPKAPANALSDLVSFARKGWEMMQDTSISALPMPHDGYLKLYQLSQPTINTQRILFDESQDANPITLDFILRQQCNKVFIGDQFQSIYGFRGAVDALTQIQADERLPLTTSFRFGSGIANLATAILRDWRGCSADIKGLGKYETAFTVDRNCPHAVISRTNGGLFAEAVMLLQTNKPFGFVGGVEGYRFDQILETYYLYANQRGNIRDPFIKSFQDFTQMRSYGETLEDMEVKSLCKVVEEYSHDIPRLIDQIKTKAQPALVGREVALSTTHKAKGLEWKNVVLTDDFTDLEITQDNKGREVRPDNEEIHILYVAITRAMKGLIVPPSVYDWAFRTGQSELLSGAALSKSEQTIATQKNNELVSWQKSMDEYFTSMRDGYSSYPEKLAEVATFLEQQALKFRS